MIIALEKFFLLKTLLEWYLNNGYNTKTMRTLGIHLDGPYLSIAVVETKGKKTKICNLQSMLSADIENVKQLYIDEASSHIAIAIPALVRNLKFEIASIKKILQILPFQVESLTSMNLQDIVYTYRLRQTPKGAESTIFLTSKETLLKTLGEWTSYSIVPDRATATFNALARFTQHFLPHLTSAFIIDLGSQRWTCLSFENGIVKQGYTIEVGSESILSALSLDLKKVLSQKEIEDVANQIDLSQLNNQLFPHLYSKLERVRCALANVLYSFQKENGPKTVLFTGRTDTFKHLCQFLLEPTPDLSLMDSSMVSLDEKKTAIAIGCALEHETQFLKNEFTPKKVWEKAGGWSVLLLVISISVTLTLLLCGHAKFQADKVNIAQSFKKVLIGQDKKLANSIFLDTIEKGIEGAAIAIQKYDKETPYILKSPSVTEVLAWISTHPLILALQNTNDPIEILSIKYQLVSFPHINAMKDPYRAKVELEFSVKGPMNARKFHEALLQGDDLVNVCEELSWDSSGDTYRTSFFLKNRPENDL